MSIVLDRLVKLFQGQAVVQQVSLELADGEFFVLLGASGSGKSTILRMIAGLVDIDGGSVLLHGRDVTRVPTRERGVGLVFQHYALFRHMSIGDNVEFALRIRGVPRAARRARRDELLELVGLSGLANRLPAQLSGGQQQRVALARALAHRPEILLLDEPFGALDAKIRLELRRTVRAIQRELGITTLFVTHDQDEAFELADRLGVLNFGRLLEVGPPDELYLRPQTEYVASFLGTANLMVGEAGESDVRLGPLSLPLGTRPAYDAAPRRVQVLFRPEDVAVKDSPEALHWPLLGQATVEEASFSGSYERLWLRIPPLPGVLALAPSVPYGADYLRVEAMRSRHQATRFPLRPGDPAWVGVRRAHALVHGGLRFIVVTDGTASAEPALQLGGVLARMCHARVTVLGHGAGASEPHLRRARELLGSGVAALEVRASPGGLAESLREEASRAEHDLVVLGLAPADAASRVEEAFAAGARHILLARGAGPLARVLICVARGEPAKDDVAFSALLLRNVGTDATLLTVLVGEAGATEDERVRAERFLRSGVRTLAQAGIRAEALVLEGDPREVVPAEAAKGHDVVVVGAPLAGRSGRVIPTGLVRTLVEGRVPVTGRAQPSVLIVRSYSGGEGGERWSR